MFGTARPRSPNLDAPPRTSVQFYRIKGEYAIPERLRDMARFGPIPGGGCWRRENH